MRLEERLDVKYKIGDRVHPVKWKDGEMLKSLKPYSGEHPEMALPVLRKLGLI